MIKKVIKADGSIEDFDLDKLSKWSQYASKVGGNWSVLAVETFNKLPEECSSADIHQTMIDVCYSKQDLVYSRVASRLEIATLRKNIERKLGIKVNKATFKEIRKALLDKGVWDSNTIPEYSEQQEALYEELKNVPLESWQVSQWSDKYLLKLDVVVETPTIAAIGIGLGLHGDNEDGYNLARDVIHGRTNLPTPFLNGIRNGDFNGVSCCVISGGDSVESIEVAQHLAVRMTAKKAGIGIEFTTRSKGSGVKNGRIKHLGKHPIYKHTDSGVKEFTQECYDEDTEVLTAKGWKLFKHLSYDDYVAQVHNDRSVTYVNPTEIVEYDVVDKGMVKFENRNININVTDNHRMIYRTAKYADRKSHTGDYSEVMAKDFVPSRTKIMDFGGFKVGTVSELTPMQRFLIAVSADGHILENKTCENSVKFTLKKPRKIERLKEILKDLGIPEREKYREKCTCYTITDSYKDDTYAVTVFRVDGLTKNLDWVYDVDFNSNWAAQFLNEVKQWDGCVGNTSFEFYSNVKMNIDVVQFVAANAGLKSTLDERGDRECWTVRISTNDKYDGMVSESIRMTESKFTGKVYCCTVPTGILIVRSNGKTLVCGNTRGGSATVSFTCIDPEVYNIALWKSQRIDIEQRLDKLDYSFVFNDAFIDAVINRKDWYLFDYGKSPEVYDVFYRGSVEQYNNVVESQKENAIKKVSAIDLIKHILLIRQETGRLYCFNVSRANTHTPFKDTIRLSNLCVAPETMILTKDGYFPIGELENQNVEVWNGKEWSETAVVKTSPLEEVVDVLTDDGGKLCCTKYHKWYVMTRDKRGKVSGYTEKRTHELVVGDELLKTDGFDTVKHGSLELHFAYESGFFTGGGCERGRTDNKHSEITIYPNSNKTSLVDFMSGYSSKAETEKYTTLRFKHGTLLDKWCIPDVRYTLKSRLSWLSGLLDADGCTLKEGESFILNTTSQEFANKLKLFLQELGVDCTCGLYSVSDKTAFVSKNSDDYLEYDRKPLYVVRVHAFGVAKLIGLGLSCNRLKLKTSDKKRKTSSKFVKVHDIVDGSRKTPVYCFNEPKRHMGMFNGILTGQCQEICLPTKPYSNMQDLYSRESTSETAFCSLGAIVPVNIESDEEYERVAYTLVKSINKLIDKCPKMTENHERTMLERKSLGIGITGLAEYLYKNNLDYVDSDENIEFVADLAEKHCYYLYKASQKLAKEFGESVDGVDFNWLPIDTKINKYTPKKDWESLRGKPRLNSVLVAHMPTESSALASGVTNGLYPPRQRIINKKSRKGVVQFICKDFVQGKNLLAWVVDNILLSKYYSAVQDYTDQAISADTYFDPRNYESGKKPVSILIKEWVAHFKLGNKSMYYVNTYDNDESSIFDIAQDDCESCKL